jgi:polysaccharide export outer membrane protein
MAITVAAQASGESAPSAVAPVAPNSPEYIIGPGDILQVFVWRNPELSVTVPVRPDGKISTPLVEDMVAVGKTPSTLARDIETLLAEYVRSPTVNIIVTQPVSRFSQIRIVGQVAKQQAIPYREGMTVLDAVLESGGLTPFAAGNRARIVREVDGKKSEIRVRLDDILNRGRLETNFEILPGDVIVVPESFL